MQSPFFPGASAGPSQHDMQRMVRMLQAGEHGQLEILAREMSSRFPRHGFAWTILAAALRAQQRHAEALPCLEKASQLAPRDAKLQFNLGNALRDLGQVEQAVSRYRQALKLQPDFAEACYQLGNLQQDMGQLADAEQSLRRAVRQAPADAKAHAGLAHTLHDLGRLEEAEGSYRRALEIAPDTAALHFNLGDLLHDRGQLHAAEAACREALRLDRTFAPAHSHLGTILQDQGRLDEAIASYREALRLQPGDLLTQSSLLFCLNYAPRCSSAEQLAEARHFGAMVAQQAGAAFTRWNCSGPAARLRVGLVSGDLREHPVGHFLESVLAHVDPARVELIAFSTVAHSDALSQRLRPHFAEWVSLAGSDDAAAAALVHARGPQVLLDLSGHTAHNRLALFARKPAPVQASWLGYFATTGVDAMDYLIADPWSLPASQDRHFTEKIWRLPQTRLCFTPPAVAIDTGPLPAASQPHLTFGCFSNVTKINDDVVALWCRVMAAVPQSRLLLKAKQFRDPLLQSAVRKTFLRHGLPEHRLDIEGPSPRGEYLQAYHRVDVGLDTFPFPGGTTTAESLWMGVPVLNLAGESFLSRQGAGLLVNAGMADWIANSTDDYVELAVRHTSGLARLADLRRNLREQVLKSPLFDAAAFARQFEDALHAMARERMGTQPPG